MVDDDLQDRVSDITEICEKSRLGGFSAGLRCVEKTSQSAVTQRMPKMRHSPSKRDNPVHDLIH